MMIVLQKIKWLAAVVIAMAGVGCGDEVAQPSTAVEDAAVTSADPTISSANIEKSLSAAQVYLDSQDVAKAQAILFTLVDKAPRELRAREMLGQSFAIAAMQAQQQRNAAGAAQLRIKAYEQYKVVVEIEPNVAGLQHSAGQMALHAGNANAALDHFQTASQLDPGNPQYPLFEAQLLIQAQQFDDAQAALLRVLELDADEAFAHASLAIIAMERQQFDSALKHIDDARRIQPDDLGFRSQEAKIHRRMGNPQRALELLVGLNADQRAQELIAFEIASAYDAIGEHIKAAKAWQHVFQANQLAANAWLAAVRAGEFLLKAGEREQAAMWLQQAQFAAPNAPEVKALEAAFER